MRGCGADNKSRLESPVVACLRILVGVGWFGSGEYWTHWQIGENHPRHAELEDFVATHDRRSKAPVEFETFGAGFVRGRGVADVCGGIGGGAVTGAVGAIGLCLTFGAEFAEAVRRRLTVRRRVATARRRAAARGEAKRRATGHSGVA
jgi:hypothetical protein